MSLRRRLAREVAAAGLAVPDEPLPIVTDADLADLPAAAQRYLRFMDVVGHPRRWSFCARFEGRFRLGGKPWMPAVAWQYNSGLEIARLYVMRLRIGGVVPMVGVDRYVRGRGEMIGKLLNVVTVARGGGDEFDLGELTTFLNDAVLLAPTFLLRPEVSWSEVDDHHVDVSLRDGGRSVTARVTIDDRGAPLDFSSRDRYADLPGGLVQAEWTTPVSGWTEVDGRPLPESAEAIWHLEDGPLTYAAGRFVPGSVTYDIGPGQI